MNAHLHLSNDDLLRAAYGLTQNDDAAIDCGECRAAVAQMRSRRVASESQRRSRIDEVLPEWFWRRQRQAVLSAAGITAGIAAGVTAPSATLRPARFRWISLAALAGIVVAGWLAMQPAPAPVVRIASEDERLLTEVSTAVNRVEPRALAPMNMLWTQ